MGSLEGLSYHWYLELLKHAGMPIYDGTEPTLKHMNVARKEGQNQKRVRKRKDNGSMHTGGWNRIDAKSGENGRGFSTNMGRTMIAVTCYTLLLSLN